MTIVNGLGGCGASATCAATSLTRHPSHSDGAFHSSSPHPSSMAARLRRSCSMTRQLVSASIPRILVRYPDYMQEPAINFGVLLFIPYRHMENRILQAIKDAGYDDMSLAQARVFQRIAPGGSRLTDLAEQAQMTKQSVAGLIAELQRMRYV